MAADATAAFAGIAVCVDRVSMKTGPTPTVGNEASPVEERFLGRPTGWRARFE